MTRDEQLAWLREQAEGDDEAKPEDALDATTAAFLRVVTAGVGWYYDPVLTPEKVLEIVEAVVTGEIRPT